MGTRLLSVVLMTLLAAATLRAQERRIRAGAAIPTLVLPTDKELVVEGSSGPPLLMGPPDGITHGEWFTEHSDLVAVIRVNSKMPMLVKNDRWIQSVVNASVEVLLKSPSELNIQEGSQVVFVEQGGVLPLGQATVRAVLRWMVPTAVGGRYLVFTERTATGDFPLLPETTYELVRSIPRKLMVGVPDDSISASTEEDVIASLQQLRMRRSNGR